MAGLESSLVFVLLLKCLLLIGGGGSVGMGGGLAGRAAILGFGPKGPGFNTVVCGILGANPRDIDFADFFCDVSNILSVHLDCESE